MQRIAEQIACKFLLAIAAVICFTDAAQSQTGDSLIAELKSIQQTVTLNTNLAISNRAMTIFLADKTGYLSATTDLSYFTNYLTVNSSTGSVAVNHNFQKATGVDEPIRKLFSAGVAATLPVNFSNGFLDRRYDNRIGLLLNYVWLGKVKTTFESAGQKNQITALRAAQFHSIEIAIKKDIQLFEQSLESIAAADVPGQDIVAAKQIMRQDFYKQLKETYQQKFAVLQAESLTATNDFKMVSTHWTSINGYVPVFSKGYFVATGYNTIFQKKRTYPAQLKINHTRMWQSSKAGKLFVTISAGATLNNSKLSYGLDATNLAAYNLNGGNDTTQNKALNNNSAFIGNYKTFVTPTVEARLVYFPGSSHIGISASIEKNFGDYKSLNGKLSLPVILINSKKTPAANFDFYVLFVDMNNSTKSSTSLSSKTIIGLSVGVPFSRLMY